MVKDFFNLFFPEGCISCELFLVTGEQYLCLKCLSLIAKAETDPVFEEKIRRKFWGKVNIYNCYTYLKYQKGGTAQKILFALKYKENKDLGYLTGRWFGYQLKQKAQDLTFDLILPVPLHKKKLKQRGYNQSEWIGKGLSETLNIPYSTEILERTSYSLSLTKSSRIDRWLSSKSIYKVCSDIGQLKGKHILIVDDVITTGSTFESISNVLYDAGVEKISIATLAAAV